MVDIESLPIQKDLSEMAYTQIRNYVIEGKLAPGTRLVESVVAKKLGVSTTPVRHAFRRLELEGLVRVVPRRFVEVIDFSAQDVTEIIDLREGLEIVAVRLAVKRCTPGDIEHLRKTLAQSAEEESSRVMSAFDQTDNNFHVYLVKMSGNGRLLNAYMPLVGQIRAILVRARDLVNWPGKTTEEHAAIVRAIEDGDAETAERILRAHIQRVKERYIRRACGSGQEQLPDEPPQEFS
jgi:DNA-binding GntR family transcriptional regulator